MFESYYRPEYNTTFTPVSSPAEGTTELENINRGLYAYVNSPNNPDLQKQSDATFGRTAPFTNSDADATLIGRRIASSTGYRSTPIDYCKANNIALPANWSGENAQLYTLIGQNYIAKAQEHYNNAKAERDKAIADAQKDITDSFNRLPEAIADSVLQADGITSHTALDKDLLQSLTKYNQGENALTAQKRAALAWQYIAPAFENVDHLQDTNRRLLLDIANALSDEKGQLDPHALAAFVMLTDKKATELQSTNSEFWADFTDKFQNFWRTTDDQIKKNGGLAYSNWRDAQGIIPERPAYYGDERVEKLYGYMNQAINTAIAPSEKAEWYAKLLSEMGGLIGESIVPMTVGAAASAFTGGLGGGAFLAATAGYAAGVAASAPSSINNAIGNAYIKGVINPELYGTLEGIGQAAAENIGGPATSLKLFTKTAGKLTNYAASRAAGSRFLANQYARTTLNYLTAGAFESVTELAEEEIGGYIGSRLNAMARSMGAEVSPQAYELGEALKGMKDYEVAAIFGYSYALGFFGIPANYRAARTFAQNTDNLLKAGHTAKTARDIQHQAFKTEDRIAGIQADESLSPEQKKAAILKEEQNFAEYQKNKFTSDALSNPNLRSRLEKEGRALRDETEVALDVEHEADIQILKEHNILEAVVVPGQKYRVSFYEEGEEQADGTRAPGKVVTQEWSRMQLTNWLMLQKDTRIEQDLRSFNALLLAHAHAQSASVEETKAHFQNLGANRPLAALGELHKNGMTPGFFQKAAQAALQLQLQYQTAGMTAQEAAQQPSPDFEGLSLGEVQTLATGAAERKEQEAATTGALQNITDDSNVEYGGLNLLARDGTALIKYVAGKANILDMLEEKFEADIKQRTRGNKTLYNQLAETLLHIQAHLPGNIQLLDPKKKGNYTKSDFVEAYSKIATGAFLYNEKNLPINAAGHRLIQNIGRAVDTTRMFQLIGNAWLNYANSPEGKEHLANGGQGIADIMQEAGFTFSRQLADARATAEQRAEVLEARNWQPEIEAELDALLEQAEEESELNEINEQEAKEPITIPADQSITGQEITIEPEPSEQETLVSSEPAPAANLTGTKATTILSHMRDLIAKGKARAEHFAIVFREIPGLTEAQATELGIRPLTQRGEPTAAYTQGKLLAERCTDVQYLLLREGKLTQKAKRDILGAPTQTRKNPAWPKRVKKGIAPAEQRLGIIKALQNAIDYAKESPVYDLNFVRHVIAKGKEYYIATDGRRLAVIERTAPKGSKNVEESLDKNGNVVKDAKFPESWRQVIISLSDKKQTLDLAPFRYLETYPKTAINHVVWQDSEGKLSKYNPSYIGKGIKFFSTLSKAIGSPSTIQVDNRNMGPILMQSDHDGWTAKYLLMPMRLVDGDFYKEGDILLNPQPDGNVVTFSIKPQQKALREEYREERQRAGKMNRDFAKKVESVVTKRIQKDGRKKWALTVKPKFILEVCPYPAILNTLKPWNGNIVMTAEVAKKLLNLHDFTIHDMSEIPGELVDPVAVFADDDPSKIHVVTTIKTPNAKGEIKSAKVVLQLKKTKKGIEIIDVKSAFSSDQTDIYAHALTRHKLMYADKERAMAWAYSEGKSIALLLQTELTDHGSAIILKEDLVNVNPENQTTATESADLFTDGVLEAQNAIVTKPGVNFSIKALHASPHNFRKFSTEKMGTGEGAQAYGWGLYFAEDEAVNKKYFNDFSTKRDTYLFDGKPMSRADIVSLFADTFEQIDKEYNAPKSAKDIAHTILWDLRDIQGGIKGAYSRQSALIEKRKKQQERNVFGVTNNLIKSSLAAHDVLKLLAEHDIQTHPATNYRVELNADDTNLLMWDERYSGQKIKDLLGKELFEQIYDEGDEEASLLDNGEGIYMLLRSVFGGKEAASKKLLEHGVKGIKYLDGNSRSAGEGSYNYVIFSGDDIKITAVNESGVWSMDEGWEDYTDSTATFSIRAAQNTMERFSADPMGERIIHLVRTEARRYARVLGDKTPQEQAVNAIASATSIIMAVDKYLHRPDKPVSRAHRNQLTKLRAIIEKYAQIIASGTPRSFKRISPTEQAELEAAIAELEAAELDTAETDPSLLIGDDKRMNKRTREARSREHHRAIVREAAKGRVYATLASMLDATADALDDYLKDQLLTKLDKLTATVKIKRTTGKRLKGKMTAPIYRKLEQAIQFMALSPRAVETAIDDIFTAQETLARAINEGSDNLTSGNVLLVQLADQLSQDGIKLTPQTLTAALTDYSNALAIYGDIESKNYEQTRLAANALFHLIQYGRNKWADRQAQREAEIQQYLQHFLANTTAASGRANAKNKAIADEAKKILSGSVLDKFMNSTQLFTALASYEPLRPLFEHLRYQLSLALDTRQKHLNEIREQELATFGHILGIKPETAAGYTSKQLQQLSDKFDAFYVENNTTHNTGITVTWQAENQDGELETYSEKLEYTNWELLDLLLMYRQEHYQANADLHGFTPEILTQIEKHIGQQLMDYGNAIQQIIIGDGTIPVYEEREGIPMRHNPLYWPGTVNINTLNTTRDEPLVNPYHPAGSYDFLKSRVRNLKELQHQNAYAKFRSAIAQRANYIYLDPVTAPLRSLLARDQFANRLTALIGPSLTKQLKTTINEITGAGHNETSLQDIGGNNKFGNALSHATLAALAGNLNSIARQASAAANAGLMPGISPVDYYKYAILVRDNNTNIGITEVLKLDCFAIRRRDNAYVNELAAMGADAKYSTLLNWTKAGMNLMDKADVLANAVSAAIVYNHKYDQLKDTGNYTEEQLRARAEAEVSQYLRLAAQPLNRVDKSALYWQLSQHALARSILYMGSESINKLGMLRLNYIINQNNGTGTTKNLGILLAKMGLTVGLASAGINALIDLLAGNTPDDDDNLAAWAMYQYLWGTVGQHTDAMPVLGTFTNAWLSPYARFGDSGVTIPGKNIDTRASKLHTMLTDNKTYSTEQWSKAVTNFMRETSAISGYLGGTYAPWQWYSTVSSVLSSLTTVANAVNVLLPAAETIHETITGDESDNRRSKRSRRLKSKMETLFD